MHQFPSLRFLLPIVQIQAEATITETTETAQVTTTSNHSRLGGAWEVIVRVFAQEEIRGGSIIRTRRPICPTCCTWHAFPMCD